jgi:hypothetical protein
MIGCWWVTDLKPLVEVTESQSAAGYQKNGRHALGTERAGTHCGWVTE